MSSVNVNLRDLPEFYCLVDTQRRDLEDSSLAGSSTAHLASSERLRNLKKKIASSSKVLTKTVADSFYGDLRKAHRPLYSRGHEIHTPGDDLPLRALGMSPIASRGHSSTNRLAASSRPATRDGITRGSSRGSLGQSGGSLSRSGSPCRGIDVYSRPVSPCYTSGGTLNSAGLSGRFSKPLQTISYSSSSTMLARPSSSGYYPSDPDNILENTRAKAVNGFTTASLCARTPLEHRRYLSQRRQVTRLKTEPYRFNLPGAEPPSSSPASPTPEQLFTRPISPDDEVGALPLSASQVQMKQNIAAINNRVTDVDGILFKIDYEPLGSKQRIKRSVCKLKTF